MTIMSLPIKGVIFEVFGTLVDSSFAMASSWKEVLDEVGVRSSIEEIQKLIGMNYEELVPKLAGVDINSTRGQEIVKRHDEIFRTRYLGQIQIRAGAKNLIEKLKSKGLQIAVLTFATEDQLEFILRKLGIFEDINVKSFRSYEIDETFQGLDRVEETLDDLGLEASEVIYFVDTPYSLEAALHFGLKTLAFRNGIWSEEELKGATFIYKDAADLVSQFDRSPFMDLSEVA